MAVTAVTHHLKPLLYPKVDDDATILLEYPNATGIIEASWDWPFGIKDLEVFGTKSYLHALNGNTLQQRNKEAYENLTVKPAAYKEQYPIPDSMCSAANWIRATTSLQLTIM